ncbi:MAG TPA: biopolymer transporter ExbD [Pseudobdellovibrionaceae bacterium]|nr:biopolymer transporter ExbD [Pseudobdellovibrionaceae bacterium]
MAIQRPGERYRYSRFLKRRAQGKRSTTVLLSLTAMVDMFTVLVIFLLQNSDPGALNFVPANITLPKASVVKDLKPAVVVSISAESVLIENESIVTLVQVKDAKDWVIPELKKIIEEKLLIAQKKYEIKNKNYIREAVANKASTDGNGGEASLNWNKVTVQADKGIDILTVKKVLTTLTVAGAREINFAVTKTAVSSTL